MSNFKVKCTKIGFGWGSVSDPLAKLTALPQIP